MKHLIGQTVIFTNEMNEKESIHVTNVEPDGNGGWKVFGKNVEFTVKDNQNEKCKCQPKGFNPEMNDDCMDCTLAKDYFANEYGENHFEMVVSLNDLKSVYGLIEEYQSQKSKQKNERIQELESEMKNFIKNYYGGDISTSISDLEQCLYNGSQKPL